jgi:hypothetical protein
MAEDAEPRRIEPMPQYQLSLKVGEEWTLFRTIDAHDHAAAMRQAIGSLGEENYDKQIKLEQVEPSPITRPASPQE